MLSEIIATLFSKPLVESYKFLDQYMISNILAFVKGFEFAIILIVACIVALIAVGVMIRQARRMPQYYFISIIDLDGNQVAIDGLRQSFSTYEGAESYARCYRKMYQGQYKFKVVGSTERIDHKVKASGRLTLH